MFTLLMLVFLAPGSGPYDQRPVNDPRLRRAMREKAVQRVGPEARDMVEAFGEPAVAALCACQIPTGQKLADFYNSGAMKKWPRPANLLAVIALPEHRDEVALWALKNHQELEDLDAFDAYLHEPLVICLRLKPLEQAAAEMRGRRNASLSAARVPDYSQFNWKENQPLILIGIGVIAMVLLAVWNRGSGAKTTP